MNFSPLRSIASFIIAMASARLGLSAVMHRDMVPKPTLIFPKSFVDIYLEVKSLTLSPKDLRGVFSGCYGSSDRLFLLYAGLKPGTTQKDICAGSFPHTSFTPASPSFVLTNAPTDRKSVV